MHGVEKMTERESHISIEILKSLTRLDKQTGKVYWNPRGVENFTDGDRKAIHSCATWNKRFSGKEAFSHGSGNGYLHGCLFNEKFYAHRIVFALFHGHWPISTIDHINGIKTDNRPENLRDVDHRENMLNQPLKKSNTTGFTGVSIDDERNKFVATITINRKTKHLGRFDIVDDAVAARNLASAEFGFHKNHGRKSS